MSNAEIIKALFAKLSRKIDARMTQLGETYSEAKAVAMESSCAGVSVWALLDSKYAK